MSEDNSEVIKAYKRILSALETLTPEQQRKAVESVSILIGYTKSE